MSNGLQLQSVVLLGRTLDEYTRYFQLDLDQIEGRVLDMGGGVSSFCAEMKSLGHAVVAADPIYRFPAAAIEHKCRADLDDVVAKLPEVLDNYHWDFYSGVVGLQRSRERAYQAFLPHYADHPASYVAAMLPQVPFADDTFSLVLVSYLLFLYDHLFDYEFHKRSIVELARAATQEVRIYPLSTLQAQPSTYLERLLADPELQHLQLEVRETPFEFVKGANQLLSVRNRLEG